jgi:uncharacterized protein YecE (DUF72 family)
MEQGRMSASCYIGTSGWHYTHWQGPFYPDDLPPAQWLAYYARYFDTVEINASFYRLPGPAAVQAWKHGTPRHFRFAIKASRYITHMKKLTQPKPSLRAFLAVARRLGNQRGPVLFQLPPRWRCNPERLAQFLRALPPSRECVFELRDASWHVPEIYALLRRHNAAFCLYELAGFSSPVELTADFTYIRLHGPAGAYSGCYGRRELSAWARRIRSWKQLKRVYVYFDNDEAGYAVRNALELKALLQA